MEQTRPVSRYFPDIMLNSRKASLVVGALAPEFDLLDAASGARVCRADYAGRNVLLVFFRGTWCPFCREQMQVLQSGHADLEKAGIVTVGVVCQSAGSVKRYLQSYPIPFPLLADERRDVARLYGTHYWFSREGFNLSQPALFILDGDGRISLAHVGRSMRDLPLDHVLKRFLTFLNDAAPARSEEEPSVPIPSAY